MHDGTIVVQAEVPPPTVPMDYAWARELGLIRKPASFMTSVSDERGQELLYAGMPISEVILIITLWREIPLHLYTFSQSRRNIGRKRIGILEKLLIQVVSRIVNQIVVKDKRLFLIYIVHQMRI